MPPPWRPDGALPHKKSSTYVSKPPTTSPLVVLTTRHQFGSNFRRCKGINPKPKIFAGTSLDPPGASPWGLAGLGYYSAAKKRLKINNVRIPKASQASQALPEPCSSQTISEAWHISGYPCNPQGASRPPNGNASGSPWICEDCSNIQKLGHVRGSPLFREGFCWHIPWISLQTSTPPSSNASGSLSICEGCYNIQKCGHVCGSPLFCGGFCWQLLAATCLTAFRSVSFCWCKKAAEAGCSMRVFAGTSLSVTG